MLDAATAALHNAMGLATAARAAGPKADETATKKDVTAHSAGPVQPARPTTRALLTAPAECADVTLQRVDRVAEEALCCLKAALESSGAFMQQQHRTAIDHLLVTLALRVSALVDELLAESTTVSMVSLAAAVAAVGGSGQPRTGVCSIFSRPPCGSACTRESSRACLRRLPRARRHHWSR
jgi:hypothetical protein